jgi:ribonuclease HI
VEPVLVEAMGVRWALQTALAQHLDNLIIFSDAANVVNCFAKRTALASIELIREHGLHPDILSMW